MKFSKLALLGALLLILFGYFAGQWIIAPATLASAQANTAYARAELLGEGRNRLKLSIDPDVMEFDCVDAPYVCGYVKVHPTERLTVALMEPEIGATYWLVSARSHDGVLLTYEASEKRLRAYRSALLWKVALLGLALMGCLVQVWRKIR